MPAFRWTPRQLGWLLKQSALEWAEDKSPKTAAALAYYSLFALGPILVIAVALAGLAFGADAAARAVAAQLARLVGAEGAKAVQGLMEAGLGPRRSALGLAVGLLALAIGAAGVFAQLREGLNKTWELEARTVKGAGAKLRLALRRNLLGFAGVLGVGFLLLVSLAVGAATAAVAGRVEPYVPGGAWAIRAVDAGLLVLVVTLLFAAMFKGLPDAKVAWRDCLVGGLFTSVLFLLGQLAIGLYLGRAATASRYGAAGAIPIVLLWTYYSSMILLYGAELTQVYANAFGRRVLPTRRAQPIQQAVAERNEAPWEEGTERSPGKGPAATAGAAEGNAPPPGARRQPAGPGAPAGRGVQRFVLEPVALASVLLALGLAAWSRWRPGRRAGEPPTP